MCSIGGSGGERVDQPLARIGGLAMNGGAEVSRHLRHAFQNTGHAIGIVLEIAEDFREIDRPALQGLVIFDGDAEHLRRDDRRHERREIRYDVRASRCDAPVDQGIHDSLNMAVQDRDARRGKGSGAYAAQAGMIRRIAKKHLTLHHFHDGRECTETHAVQLVRGKSAIGRKALKNGDDVRVAGHYPGMQERVPEYGIGLAQLPVKLVRGGHDLRLEETAQGERGLHSISSREDEQPRRPRAHPGRATSRRSTSSASRATVLASNKWRGVNWTLKRS